VYAWKCNISFVVGKELCTQFAQADSFVSYFDLTVINNITSGGRRLLFYSIRSVRFYALKHIGAILVRCISNKSLRPASFLGCQRDTARTCCGAPLPLNAPAAGMRGIRRCDKLGYMGKTLFRYFDHVSGSR